ncbi:hypothetical protein EV714DRAFT_243973, partial [Schizophyllum commune]
MSSRGDYRRRDDRGDRDRDRYSRGGGGGHTRRPSSRSRSPRRDDRDRDRRDRRDYERKYDEPPHRERDRGTGRDADRRYDRRDRDDRRADYRPLPPRRPEDRDDRRGRYTDDAPPRGAGSASGRSDHEAPAHQVDERPNLDPDAPNATKDEPMEEMDEEAAMMQMMGLSGFGTTKNKHVEGNQEGAVDIKKMRTWRQYMNRSGEEDSTGHLTRSN